MSTFQKHRSAGSMTVEAALILPLFLFFFLNISSAMEMLRLHGNLELALWSVGNRMSVYGHALGEEHPERLAGLAFSYTYIKHYICEYLGEAYLENTPILGGVNGLQFLESDILAEGDTVEIVVAYGVSPYSSIVGFRPFGMVNHYYGHVWNGYELPLEESRTASDIVYIAENGAVFHKNPDCTYLKLSIRETTLGQAVTARNIYGEKYHMCSICGMGNGKWELNSGTTNSQVWITSEGDCIHYNRNCSGLKRTIYAVERSEIPDYRPCSRCAK
ncbi:MAG: hypothetical protein IJ833_05210 [Lachnospiraceae bacterium]|nr:hypothetical protein [Lachnospiraceae bacterium]